MFDRSSLRLIGNGIASAQGGGAGARIEALEPRLFLSASTLGTDLRRFSFTDGDGDRITARLHGPGTAAIMLDDDADGGADIDSILLADTTNRTRLLVRVRTTKGGAGDGTTTISSITGGSAGSLLLRGVTLDGSGVQLTGGLNRFRAERVVGGADVITQTAGTRPLRFDVVDVLGDGENPAVVRTPGAVRLARVRGRAAGLEIDAGGPVRRLRFDQGAEGVSIDAGDNVGHIDVKGDAHDLRARIEGTLDRLRIKGNGTESGSLLGARVAARGGVGRIRVAGDVLDALLLAGTRLDDQFGLSSADFGVAEIGQFRAGGHIIDSIIAAGGDPGADRLFENGDVLEGGMIGRLQVGGMIAGADSPHINPGVYTAAIGKVEVNGARLGPKAAAAGIGVVGTAVIDPIPTIGNELKSEDGAGGDGIKTILARAVARARQLGVNATISIVDREGQVLAVVRTTIAGFDPAPTVVDIRAGGAGGLEIIDAGSAVEAPSSLASISKAGTAAFLSTSRGNAFTTRTAGFIIQRHFPPRIQFQDSGPLYGVQFSSLPTSDVNRLPLGVSADPGGLPLYRAGELVGSIGVEVNGIYTVDPGGVGGSATIEEKIALAGQIGFQPPRKIRADRVFVDGIRFDYANGRPPRLGSLTPDLTAYDDLVAGGELTELLGPMDAPTTSKFMPGLLMTSRGPIVGEIPADPTGLDFSGGFVDGVSHLGEFVSVDEVTRILEQAHALNSHLRAQIRKDRPQISRVTVSVVDLDGNVLGVFRADDAPVFGYDVSVQKARTAAYFSRPVVAAGGGTTADPSGDAGDELRDLDGEIVAEVGAPTFDLLFGPTNPTPFTTYADAARDIGVDLDGTVAVADRTGGFLSRDRLPDGIPGAPRGPFSSILDGDDFSVFNTGLQTSFLLPNIAVFLTAFDTETGLNGEASALAGFVDGSLGGGGIVGGGVIAGDLPGLSLNNGMQIFAGSVPLYEDGVLVGGLGVSGDGIEQDDFIAFAGATGFQEFGDVRRADDVKIINSIRLPYVKFPRTPFGGM